MPYVDIGGNGEEVANELAVHLSIGLSAIVFISFVSILSIAFLQVQDGVLFVGGVIVIGVYSLLITKYVYRAFISALKPRLA